MTIQTLQPAPRPRARRTRLAIAAMALEIVLGIGALAGGAALMAGPRGEIIALPVSALDGSPFVDYFVPGLVLFVVLGVGPLAAAFLAWRGHPSAPVFTVAVGVGLLIWLAVQIATIGYSNDPPLQPLYLGLGVFIALVGIGWMHQVRSLATPGTAERPA
jgi:hypothetical protein